MRSIRKLTCATCSPGSSRAIPWRGSTSYCRSPTCRRQTRLRPDNTAYNVGISHPIVDSSRTPDDGRGGPKFIDQPDMPESKIGAIGRDEILSRKLDLLFAAVGQIPSGLPQS